jgi:hypothetical protein
MYKVIKWIFFRSNAAHGPYQDISTVKPASKYYYEARMKILNLPPKQNLGKIQLDVTVRGGEKHKRG